MTELNPEALTWTGLLAQWVKFAQASLAIPDDAQGPRWRESIPAIINLQAVTFALEDLDRVAKSEHGLALDKAEILIEQSVSTLHRAWSGANLLDSLQEIISDARTALDARRNGFLKPETYGS